MALSPPSWTGRATRLSSPHSSWRPSYTPCGDSWHQRRDSRRSQSSQSMTMATLFSPSHLSTSTLRCVPAWIMTCHCLRSSAISVAIWFLAISFFIRSRLLSFGLPRFCFPSTVICNIFLVASSLSHLCTCPNHLNLFSLRNSAIGYMCASFQMSTFLT